MASEFRKAQGRDLEQIRRGVESEVKRLSRYRLKSSASDSSIAITRLQRAGVLTKDFASLLKRILTANGRAMAGRLGDDAPDALAILRIFPNKPA